MELLLIGLLLWVVWIYIPKLDKKDEGSAGCNPPLQVIYETDEFYRLRLKYDKLIEEDWQKYRSGEITSEQYEAASDKAVKEIVDEENSSDKLKNRYRLDGIRVDNSEFNTLFRVGTRNAAFRVAQEGFNPGRNPYSRSIREVRLWIPTGWERDKGEYQKAWRLENRSPEYFFLQLYPNPYFMSWDYKIGTWHKEDGSWSNEQEYSHGYGSNVYGIFAPKCIKYTNKVLTDRGYNGKTYLNEPPRDYGGLTEEEIKMKYEFITKK